MTKEILYQTLRSLSTRAGFFFDAEDFIQKADFDAMAKRISDEMKDIPKVEVLRNRKSSGSLSDIDILTDNICRAQMKEPAIPIMYPMLFDLRAYLLGYHYNNSIISREYDITRYYETYLLEDGSLCTATAMDYYMKDSDMDILYHTLDTHTFVSFNRIADLIPEEYRELLCDYI